MIAADAVDEAARTLDARVPPSCTADVPLLGRYGSCARELLEMTRLDDALAAPLPGASGRPASMTSPRSASAAASGRHGVPASVPSSRA